MDLLNRDRKGVALEAQGDIDIFQGHFVPLPYGRGSVISTRPLF
jgi:hypothetical protein